MNRSLWALVFVASVVSAGCETKSVPVGVSGTVTLGGAPLDGNISFIPNSGSQQAAGWAEVTAGKYSIPTGSGLALGGYRVEIRSMKSSAAPGGGDELPTPAQELVPARYNSKSDLTVTLKSGENTADFDLKPK